MLVSSNLVIPTSREVMMGETSKIILHNQRMLPPTNPHKVTYGSCYGLYLLPGADLDEWRIAGVAENNLQP